MIIRLRPCMRWSTSLLSSTHPLPPPAPSGKGCLVNGQTTKASHAPLSCLSPESHQGETAYCGRFLLGKPGVNTALWRRTRKHPLSPDLAVRRVLGVDPQSVQASSQGDPCQREKTKADWVVGERKTSATKANPKMGEGTQRTTLKDKRCALLNHPGGGARVQCEYMRRQLKAVPLLPIPGRDGNLENKS